MMGSASFFLGLLPVLVVGISFQDELVARNPIDHIAIRNPQADGNNGALFCSGIAALFNACDAATPGIFSSAVTVIAGCLCYSAGTYVPSIFDDSIKSCADYASTALPFSDYSAASVFEDFCTNVGPSPAASPATPIAPATTTPVVGVTTSPNPTPAATTSAASGGGGGVNIFTNPGCSFVSAALSFCNSASPGFSTMNPSSQAPCLCYSSTSWDPNFFDGAVKTCADYVSTADPAEYTDIVSIAGFCSSVGDVAAAVNGGVSTTGGVDGGGFGLTIGGGGQTTSQGATVTVPNPTSSRPPAVTTIKSGDAASIRNLSTNWVIRMVFVAVSAAFML